MLTLMDASSALALLLRVQGLAQATARGLRWYARAVVFASGLLWVVLMVQWKEPGSSWIPPILGLGVLLVPGLALYWFSGMTRSVANLEMADDLRSVVRDTRADIGTVREAGLIAGLLQGLWAVTRRKGELMEVAARTMMSFKLVSPLGLLGIVLAGAAGALIILAAALAALTLAL